MATYEPYGLGIETPQIHRKYLGEADDPHFIPSSPLISRQYLTPQEEGELKRICALVLANVQHSDDPPDDPLATLPEHLRAPAQPVIQQKVDIPPVPKLSDSATDSRASSRGNFGSDKSLRTVDSTPLTSVGITPDTAKFKHDYFTQLSGGKTGKNGNDEVGSFLNRFRSDKSSTSPPSTAQQLTMRMIASTFDEPPRTERPFLQPHNTRTTMEKVPTTTTATRSLTKTTTRVPTGTEPRPTTSSTHSDSESKLNKMVKSISRKRSTTNLAESAVRSASSASEPVPVLPTIATLMDMPTRSQPASPLIPQAKLPAMTSPESKSKFRFRLFGRKHKVEAVHV